MKQLKTKFISEIKDSKYFNYVRCFTYFSIFYCFLYLFQQQAEGKFFSDLVLHIKAALGHSSGSYSIVFPIFRVLHSITGNNYGICVFLALVEIFTIALTEKLLTKLIPDKTRYFYLIFALVANFMIGIYSPFIGMSIINTGLITGNKWHNSTYLFMRLVALLVMYLYIIMDKSYLKKISVKDYISFSFLLILTTMIKPNFLFAFAPAMLVVLIYDLIKTKGKGFRQIVIFGTAVLPTLIVIACQYLILFNPEASSGDGGIAIGFAVLWRESDISITARIVQSLAFPIFVALSNIYSFKNNRQYVFSWIMFAIGFLEFLFFYETGERMSHGNFAWGLSFTVFYLNITTIQVFINSFIDKRKDKLLYKFTGFGILALHLLSGIYYFLWLLWLGRR